MLQFRDKLSYCLPYIYIFSLNPPPTKKILPPIFFYPLQQKIIITIWTPPTNNFFGPLPTKIARKKKYPLIAKNIGLLSKKQLSQPQKIKVPPPNFFLYSLQKKKFQPKKEEKKQQKNEEKPTTFKNFFYANQTCVHQQNAVLL